MTFTKIYDPQGEFCIQFAHDDYDGVLKFLGGWAELPIEFDVVDSPVFGTAFEFKTSILEEMEMSRVSYKRITQIFEKLCEKTLPFYLDKQYPLIWEKMHQKWEKILNENGWTLDEWELELCKQVDDELNNKINDKYKCPECGWTGDENDLVYSDKNNIFVCPRCVEWYDIEILPDII
jgi:predicted RNA-binding Zn-ribbon protein involved in translation (DUF1610 family)